VTEGQHLVKPHSHAVCVSHAKKFKNEKQKENENETLRGHRAEPRAHRLSVSPIGAKYR
jgi:hypothetical protein